VYRDEVVGVFVRFVRAASLIIRDEGAINDEDIVRRFRNVMVSRTSGILTLYAGRLSSPSTFMFMERTLGHDECVFCDASVNAQAKQDSLALFATSILHPCVYSVAATRQLCW
jgi:hypothetical protein